MEKIEKSTKNDLDAKQRHLAKLKKKLAKQERKLERSLRVSQAKEHVRRKLKEQALLEDAEKNSLATSSKPCDITVEEESFLNDSDVLSPKGKVTLAGLNPLKSPLIASCDLEIKHNGSVKKHKDDEYEHNSFCDFKLKKNQTITQSASYQEKVIPVPSSKEKITPPSTPKIPNGQKTPIMPVIENEKSGKNDTITKAGTGTSSSKKHHRSHSSKPQKRGSSFSENIPKDRTKISPGNDRRSSDVSDVRKSQHRSHKTVFDPKIQLEVSCEQTASKVKSNPPLQVTQKNISKPSPKMAAERNQGHSESKMDSSFQKKNESKQTHLKCNESPALKEDKSLTSSVHEISPNMEDSGISQSSVENSRTSFLNDSLRLTPTFSDEGAEKNEHRNKKRGSLKDIKQKLNFQPSEIEFTSSKTEIKQTKDEKINSKRVHKRSESETIEFVSQSKSTSKDYTKSTDIFLNNSENGRAGNPLELNECISKKFNSGSSVESSQDLPVLDRKPKRRLKEKKMTGRLTSSPINSSKNSQNNFLRIEDRQENYRCLLDLDGRSQKTLKNKMATNSSLSPLNSSKSSRRDSQNDIRQNSSQENNQGILSLVAKSRTPVKSNKADNFISSPNKPYKNSPNPQNTFNLKDLDKMDIDDNIVEVSESDSQKSVSILVDTSKSIDSSMIIDAKISDLNSDEDNLNSRVISHIDTDLLKTEAQGIFGNGKTSENLKPGDHFSTAESQNNLLKDNSDKILVSKDQSSSKSTQQSDSTQLCKKRRKFKRRKRSISQNNDDQESLGSSQESKRVKITENSSQDSILMDGFLDLKKSPNNKVRQVCETSASCNYIEMEKIDLKTCAVKSLLKDVSCLNDSNSKITSVVDFEKEQTSNQERQLLEYSEFTELDVVEFSQFKFSEEFLSEPLEGSETRKRKRHPSHLGMIVQRRSPRMCSLVDTDSSSSGYSQKSHRKTKQEKCLMISSVFQYLIDETKRKSDIQNFQLPNNQFKNLVDLKILENKFDLDNNSSCSALSFSQNHCDTEKDHNLTPKDISETLPLTKHTKENENCCSSDTEISHHKGIMKNDSKDENESSSKTVNYSSKVNMINAVEPGIDYFKEKDNFIKTTQNPNFATKIQIADNLENEIKVIYDSEPMPDDSMSEENCFQRNDATDIQEKDLSVASGKETPEIDSKNSKSNESAETILKLSAQGGVDINTIRTETNAESIDANLEKSVEVQKEKSGKSDNLDDVEVTFDQKKTVTRKSVTKIEKSKQLFQNSTSTPKNLKSRNQTPSTPSAVRMESVEGTSSPNSNLKYIATPKVLKEQLDTFRTPKSVASTGSNFRIDDVTTPKSVASVSDVDDFTTPKDANLRHHLHLHDDNLSPPLFNTQKDLTPDKGRLLDDETIDSYIQYDEKNDCNDMIEPIECLKLCREESVVFISSGTWMSDGQEQNYMVCLLPSAVSVWSKCEGQWENELDWYLSSKYQAIDGWIIKKANKIVLIILEEDKEGEQEIFVFYYDLLSGDSNLSQIDLAVPENKLVTGLLCSIVNNDQLVIGYNHPTSLSATKHVLINGFQKMALCCHLESSSGYLIDIKEVRHLECCIVGLTAKRDALIWNHEEGFLLKKINLESVITPGVSLTAIHNLQGFLLFHILNRVKSDSPGYVIVVNIINETSLILHDYQSFQFSWKGFKNADVTGESLLATDINGNVGFWDILSGELLADLPRSNVTSGYINQSDGMLYLGLDRGLVQIYSVDDIFDS